MPIRLMGVIRTARKANAQIPKQRCEKRPAGPPQAAQHLSSSSHHTALAKEASPGRGEDRAPRPPAEDASCRYPPRFQSNTTPPSKRLGTFLSHFNVPPHKPSMAYLKPTPKT